MAGEAESSEASNTMRRLRHELRTLIGQITGYGEMLREELVDREQSDLVPDVDRIRSAADKLLGRVDEIFSPESTLPTSAPVSASTSPASPNATAPLTASQGARLLAVDDDDANRELLARRLRAAGYDVTLASDAHEALRRIEAEPYDLVLLDVLMPGMDGFEALQAIRRTRSPAELPVVMATSLQDSADTVRALKLGANDYVTKPFDFNVIVARIEMQLSLHRALQQVEQLARQLEIRNSFVKQTFGRYLSDEIVENLLESQEGLEIQGEKRRVSILTADLRGFSTLTEAFSAAEIVSILNNHLGTMADIVVDHGGTIDEFLGDAILCFFGAPVAGEDDAAQAVACALAMQLAVPQVNTRNAERGLPPVEMGIGIATGDAVVGNIGSERRTKYGAVGVPVNLASRIESGSVGGEVWIDPETRAALGDRVGIDDVREIRPKGSEAPVTIHRVVAIGAPWNRTLESDRGPIEELREPVAVLFTLLEGKRDSDDVAEGVIWARRGREISIRASAPVEERADMRLDLIGGEPGGRRVPCYAKVIALDAEGFTVRLTTTADAIMARLEELLPGGPAAVV